MRQGQGACFFSLAAAFLPLPHCCMQAWVRICWGSTGPAPSPVQFLASSCVQHCTVSPKTRLVSVGNEAWYGSRLKRACRQRHRHAGARLFTVMYEVCTNTYTYNVHAHVPIRSTYMAWATECHAGNQRQVICCHGADDNGLVDRRHELHAPCSSSLPSLPGQDAERRKTWPERTCMHEHVMHMSRGGIRDWVESAPFPFHTKAARGI